MGRQPVLRLEKNAVAPQLSKHDPYQTGAECLSAASGSLGEDSAVVLGSCDFEAINFDEPLPEFFDADWTDPSSRLESLLGDGLSNAADMTAFDDSPSYRAHSRPSSSQCQTTQKHSSLFASSHLTDASSTLGKESATSKNLDLHHEVSMQPSASSKPTMRGTPSHASRGSHNPGAGSDAENTYKCLYEETRSTYLRELKKLYDFLVNSYKSAGKNPNSEGKLKLEELRGLIEFFTPKRGELEPDRLMAAGLTQLRHLRDVARAYVQFYRTMKPPSTSKRQKTTSLAYREDPSRRSHPSLHTISHHAPEQAAAHHHPLHSSHPPPGPNPFAQPAPRSLRGGPHKHDRSEIPPSPPSQAFTHAPSHSSHYTQSHTYPSLQTSSRSDDALSHSLDTDSARSYSMGGLASVQTTPHAFSPQLSDSDMSAYARDSPTLSGMSGLSDSGARSNSGNPSLRSSSLKLPLDQMSLQESRRLMTTAASGNMDWSDDARMRPSNQTPPKHRLSVPGYFDADSHHSSVQQQMLQQQQQQQQQAYHHHNQQQAPKVQQLQLQHHHQQQQVPTQHPRSGFGHSLHTTGSSRPAGLQLPMSDGGSSSSGTAGRPVLSDAAKRRGMLQTASAASHGYSMELPPEVPRMRQQGRRMRLDALKTMPVMGYGMGVAAAGAHHALDDAQMFDDPLGVPLPQLRQSMAAYEGVAAQRQPAQQQQQQQMLHMSQMGMLPVEDADLLQALSGKGMQVHGLMDDMDMLGGLGGPSTELPGWLSLEDCLQMSGPGSNW